MFNYKHCPFCGGYIKFESITECVDSIKTAVSCTKCRMYFLYEQNFSYSKNERIAMNNSFEETWDNRIDCTLKTNF